MNDTCEVVLMCR